MSSINSINATLAFSYEDQFSNNINTFTDHPAYQYPIQRSDFQNDFRAIVGWGLMIVFGILGVGLLITGIYLLFEFLLGVYYGYSDWGVVLASVAPTLSSVISIFISLRLFQYGRHLTRPSSREFV